MPAARKQSSMRLHVAKAAAQRRFRKIRGIEGVGLGDNSLRVYVVNEDIGERLPSEVHGVPVKPVVTGEVFAL
jgi:hypothetical protein